MYAHGSSGFGAAVQWCEMDKPDQVGREDSFCISKADYGFVIVGQGQLDGLPTLGALWKTKRQVALDRTTASEFIITGIRGCGSLRLRRSR